MENFGNLPEQSTGDLDYVETILKDEKLVLLAKLRN
jgi:hypothetical protein